MRILHYSLGFPPYRTGGMTKFCMDLMQEQVKQGHEVSLLWPGRIQVLGKTIRVKQGKNIEGVGNYEVINPLPVPFDEGIKNFEEFQKIGDKAVYKKFLEKLTPDVIHIHTLMGLHKALLDVGKEKNIRLVFTTHDFFPICPKVTMFRHGKICESIESCIECGVCNNTALDLGKIRILQSPLYKFLKDSIIVKELRKRHRDNYLGADSGRDRVGAVGDSNDYIKLRAFYQSMLAMMDVVHYNSSIAKFVYERVLDINDSLILPISHSDMADHKKRKIFPNERLRIRYLGPQGQVKGFFLLKAALDKLWEERQDFCLDVHFTPMKSSPYMKVHDRYNYNELSRIFDETDVLVTPSIWYETFGYTVLEALSYGVPVIISGTVGAKDVLVDGAGIVIDDIDSNRLYNVIKRLSKDKLEEMNRVIVKKQSILTIFDMTESIIKNCYMGA